MRAQIFGEQVIGTSACAGVAREVRELAVELRAASARALHGAAAAECVQVRAARRDGRSGAWRMGGGWMRSRAQRPCVSAAAGADCEET